MHPRIRPGCTVRNKGLSEGAGRSQAAARRHPRLPAVGRCFRLRRPDGEWRGHNLGRRQGGHSRRASVSSRPSITLRLTNTAARSASKSCTGIANVMAARKPEARGDSGNSTVNNRLCSPVLKSSTPDSLISLKQRNGRIVPLDARQQIPPPLVPQFHGSPTEVLRRTYYIFFPIRITQIALIWCHS